MKTKPYNRLVEINKYLSKFNVSFEMKDDAIDTRTMADNYENGIIPLADIADAIDIVLGPQKHPVERDPFDPRTGVVKFCINGLAQHHVGIEAKEIVVPRLHSQI